MPCPSPGDILFRLVSVSHHKKYLVFSFTSLLVFIIGISTTSWSTASFSCSSSLQTYTIWTGLWRISVPELDSTHKLECTYVSPPPNSGSGSYATSDDSCNKLEMVQVFSIVALVAATLAFSLTLVTQRLTQKRWLFALPLLFGYCSACCAIASFALYPRPAPVNYKSIWRLIFTPDQEDGCAPQGLDAGFSNGNCYSDKLYCMGGILFLLANLWYHLACRSQWQHEDLDQREWEHLEDDEEHQAGVRDVEVQLHAQREDLEQELLQGASDSDEAEEVEGSVSQKEALAQRKRMRREERRRSQRKAKREQLKRRSVGRGQHGDYVAHEDDNEEEYERKHNRVVVAEVDEKVEENREQVRRVRSGRNPASPRPEEYHEEGSMPEPEGVEGAAQ